MSSYNNGPLRSWDIFLDGYSRLMDTGKDIQALQHLAVTSGWATLWDFKQKLAIEKKVVLVTNPALDIVFASSNIYAMNAYLPEEVLGRKPKMFQGAGTSKETAGRIRIAIDAAMPFSETLTNYRKDGRPYECYIDGFPVFGNSGSLISFIAFENIA